MKATQPTSFCNLPKRTVSIVIGLFLFSVAAFGQAQIGQTIFGDKISDYSGGAVSLSDDGSIVAVGSQLNDQAFIDAGQVRVFQFNGTDWIPLGEAIYGEQTDERSGISTVISGDGNTVVVGAYLNDNTAMNAGQVRVFRYDGNAWSQLGSYINGTEQAAAMGYTVAISQDGNIIAAGATGANGHAGNVKVFEYRSGNWVQLGDSIVGTGSKDYSGEAIALSSDGKVVAIGASRHNDYTGEVRVLEYTAGNWAQLGNSILGDTLMDDLGSAISLSADGYTLAVAAPVHSAFGYEEGIVRVFHYSSGNWVQLGADLAGENEADYFGKAISLSHAGDLLAVHDRYITDEELYGQVRVYGYVNDTWEQVGRPLYGSFRGENFGYAVSMSGDGSTYAIGAPYTDTSRGTVRVYSVHTAGISNLGELVLKLYPNPVHTSLYVSGMDASGRSYQLFDHLGHLVLEGELKGASGTIKLSGLNAGYYTVLLSRDGLMERHRIILMR